MLLKHHTCDAHFAVFCLQEHTLIVYKAAPPTCSSSIKYFLAKSGRPPAYHSAMVSLSGLSSLASVVICQVVNRLLRHSQIPSQPSLSSTSIETFLGRPPLRRSRRLPQPTRSTSHTEHLLGLPLPQTQSNTFLFSSFVTVSGSSSSTFLLTPTNISPPIYIYIHPFEIKLLKSSIKPGMAYGV